VSAQLDEDGPVWYLYRVRGFVEPKLYIGITCQDIPYARLQQHVGDLAGNIAGGGRVTPKWWAPLAAGWDLDPTTYATKAEALEAEEAAIKRERPRCNDVHNRDNPDRWRSMADVPIEQRPRGTRIRQPRRTAPASRPAPSRPDPGRGRRYAIAAVAAIWLGVFGSLESLIHNPGGAGAVTVLAFGLTWHKTRGRRARR
jgi:hypothetical protein